MTSRRQSIRKVGFRQCSKYCRCRSRGGPAWGVRETASGLFPPSAHARAPSASSFKIILAASEAPLGRIVVIVAVSVDASSPGQQPVASSIVGARYRSRRGVRVGILVSVPGGAASAPRRSAMLAARWATPSRTTSPPLALHWTLSDRSRTRKLSGEPMSHSRFHYFLPASFVAGPVRDFCSCFFLALLNCGGCFFYFFIFLYFFFGVCTLTNCDISDVAWLFYKIYLCRPCSVYKRNWFHISIGNASQPSGLYISKVRLYS